MILITIVTGAYKPTNITGGAHIVEMMVNAGLYAGHGNLWENHASAGPAGGKTCVGQWNSNAPLCTR